MNKQTTTKKYTIINFINDLIKRLRNKSKRRVSDEDDYRNRRKLLFKIEQFPSLLLKDTRERYDLLRKLKSISEDQKWNINPYLVARYAALLARLYIIEDRLHTIRDWVYKNVQVIFIILIGLIYNAYVQFTNFDIPVMYNGVLDYLFDVEHEVAILTLYLLTSSQIAGKIEFRNRLLLILIIITGGLYYLWNTQGEYELIAFGIVGIETIRLISIVLDTLISNGREIYAQRKLSNAIVVHNILLILSEIDDDNKCYLPIHQKQFLLTRLEYAASYLEKGIHRMLKTSDKIANDWNKEQLHQIASALRARKKLIVLSKSDVCKKLRKSLVSFLIHFQRNEWGELDRFEINQQSWKKTMQNQFSIIARTLFIGLLPLGIILILEQIESIKFDGSFLIPSAVAWLFINVLQLDSVAKGKFDTLKNVTEFIKPGKIE